MQELARFMATFERFNGKVDCASTLAEVLKSNDEILIDMCGAVLHAIDDYNHIKQFFK